MERNDAQELSEFWEFQKEVKVGDRVQYYVSPPPRFIDNSDWISSREIIANRSILEYYRTMDFKEFQQYKFKIIK